ncbi:MAG TPA: vWA domain-containing protein [Myxococcota bacterium]|nr:vWA domain-containing protein [Myxococcota bacterium]
MSRKLEIRNLHRAALFVLLVGATAATPFVRQAFGTTVVTATGPVVKPAPAKAIEAVFVLDTTGSMSGLIEGAKRKIWSIADAMSGNSPGVPIRVGLVAYRDRGDEYVTRRVDLTEDLDAVWAQLRELRADGGGDTPESVNEALHEAVTKLSWSSGPTVYRVVFLVGDAPPHLDYPQDVGFRQSAGLAAQKDIVINTVQCGGLPETTPIWQEIAKLGLGQFAAIGQDGAMIAVATPQDDELAALNRKLAATVIPYGDAAAQAEVKNKVAASLAAPAEAAASRLSYLAKRGGRANLGREDLVDAVASGSIAVKDVPPAALPEPLQKLDADERQKYVETKREERRQIQEEIAKLGAERDKFLQDAEAKKPADGFDARVRETVKEQAAKKGIK